MSETAPVNDDVERNGDEELQETVDEKQTSSRQLFGTFGGVFTPTLLTILGVIMYLRTGWVVGNAGLLGAFLIILLSFGITACTGLSLSSITTNIRIGAGGAFSVISQSLGLEVGGSVGVPLYLSQALAVSMYIFGFRAGWLQIFPDHPALAVDLVTFGALFVIAFLSAGLAFRIQYVIMAVILVSLVSVGVAAWQGSMTEPVTWWGDFRGAPENDFAGVGFWVVFAVFFPASTGIMAGANMSGDLRDARKSIPVGTLAAIGVSLVVYLALAYWLARSATNEELTSNYTVMLDKAAWAPAILAGLLGATFSSALASLVGAPRILQALGEHRILPRGDWLAHRSAGGEPRNALMLTGIIVFGALTLRNLNAVAPLITMFFLLTYGMINVVVLIEQNMRLVSFRPLFSVPRLVPLLGTLGCGFAMFIVNPTFSLVAVAVVLAIHWSLIRRHLKAPFGDVRSGLYVALAEWAAKKMAELSVSRERTWKANLLVPVEREGQAAELAPLITPLAYPKGFVKIVGLSDRAGGEVLEETLPERVEAFREEKLFSSWTVITAATFGDNLRAGIQTFGSTFFRPTVLLLRVPEDETREDEVRQILATAVDNRIGVILVDGQLETLRQTPRAINVWFRNRGPDWDVEMQLDNQDLAVLAGYKGKQNWQASLRLVAVAPDVEAEAATSFLETLAELARLPNVTVATRQDAPEDGADIPPADVNLLPVEQNIEFDSLRRLGEQGGIWLFTLDSGQESALA